MKRILLDARYLDGSFSGIATYSRCLLEHLAQVDKENHYQVIVRPSFNGDIQLGENFELLSWKPRPISLQTVIRLHDFTNELNPDIFHALHPMTPVFHEGNMMVTVHDMQPFTDPNFHGRRLRPIRNLYRNFYRWAYPNAFSRAKWILCVSYATRDDMARLLPGTVPKLVVVPSGLEVPLEEPLDDEYVQSVLTKHDLRGPYLIYYGSTRPNKNLPNMVRAFSRLRAENPRGEGPGNLTLVLVVRRDRFFRDVERVIQHEGLGEAVKVLPPVSQKNKQVLLKSAAAMAFVTKHEGFGFPPLEAMAAGVPVVAGKSGSLPEVLGSAAQWADPEDPADMAAAFAEVLDNEKLRARLIKRGHERAGAFSWTDAALRVRDIYNLLF